MTKILIAEDDRDFSGILNILLAKEGYEVKTVYDGAQALKEVRSWQPNILVLDIMMPIIDGFHVCGEINEDHTLLTRPKIVIMSSRSSEWDKDLGEACGVEAYFVKPFNSRAFLEKIAQIVRSFPAEKS